jgi:hypothetical protein
MSYLGSRNVGATLTFYSTTRDPSTGAATDTSTAPTYRIYEDETSDTLVNGSLALLDSANTAGLYSEQITLNSSDGFEVGKDYVVYKETVVGGVTVNAHDHFQVLAPVDAVRISGSQATADNIETALGTSDTFDNFVNFYDGTGYAGGAILLDVNVADINTSSAAEIGVAINVGAFTTDTGETAATAVAGSVVGEVDAQISALNNIATSDVAGEITTGLATLNDLSAAEVNAEVVDALFTDTYAEPGAGAPPATTSLVGKINYLYKAWRNRKVQTPSILRIYNDDATTIAHTASLSATSDSADIGEMTSSS